MPSENLPTGIISSSTSTSSRREERYDRRKNLDTNSEGKSDLCETKTFSEGDKDIAENLLQLLKGDKNQDISEHNVNSVLEQTSNKTKSDMCDFEVQVNSDRISTLCDLLNTESALRSFTGLNNFELLKCLEVMVKQVLQDSRTHRLTIKQRIILTMTKLKLDLSYVTLAILFNISGQLCKNYFSEMVIILARILKPCIYFPSSEEISKNMPVCFKNFANCRVILDCTEIAVQKPSCLCCRIKFYSQYKRSITVKFMTGVSPAGVISFVSKAYGGRASDKFIFEESMLINKLDSNKDAIMVDKGFLIDDICAIYKIKLIRPPFLKQKNQLSAEEAFINQQIASARVHIERSNQRLKIFKIISGKIQWSLVPIIDELFVIICGITNLSASILSDERF